MADLLELVMLLSGRQFAVLTGAGISTDSGIPDYRGPQTRARARKPMRFAAFTGDETHRRRYWARAAAGYSRVARAQPNPAHEALSALQSQMTGLITQNVDGLHQAAGHQEVIDLHGSLSRVVCLECGKPESRATVQERMARDNPEHPIAQAHAPDGDADIDERLLDAFRVPTCLGCRGALKPDVVFFGENVPKVRVAAAEALVERCEALLVVGSSLTVFSGYRFVRQAARAQVPVAIVTLGPSRGDEDATLKLEAPVGQVLPALARALAGYPMTSSQTASTRSAVALHR